MRASENFGEDLAPIHYFGSKASIEPTLPFYFVASETGGTIFSLPRTDTACC
jgi:hypothetical protein